MKTGFYELDNIVKLNSPQLIVCSSADYVIESFFTNILRNIKEEREKIQEADLPLKSSQLFLKHIESITLNDFKEVCLKYKTSNKANIIILNDINTIKDSSKLKILKELQELSKKLNITIIIGYNLIKKEIISLECELENIKQKCNYIDTIFLLREGTGEDFNILNIWVIKNKNKTLGKVSLLYLEDYKKYVNIERYIDIECEKNKLKAIEDINMKYFNGIMSPSWYNDIDLWFSKYGFDEQVMISLFKYCYERCAMHIRYIQEVAKEWAENNIKTPKDLELYIQKKEEENG